MDHDRIQRNPKGGYTGKADFNEYSLNMREGWAAANIAVGSVTLSTTSIRGMNMKNRREIVKASAAFVGVLSAFGLLGGNALAQRARTLASTETNTLKLIVEEALVAKDMSRVLPKYEGRITVAQKDALAKLTMQDLTALSNIKAKLAAAENLMQGHEGGIIY